MSDYFKLVGRIAVPCERYDFINQNRRVAYDEINGWRVSTVFLGINHQYSDGPPLLFETYVFPGESWSEAWGERCSTYDEAEEQHKRGLDWAKINTPELEE